MAELVSYSIPCITLLIQTGEPWFVRGQRQITIDWDVERHDAEVVVLQNQEHTIIN